MAVTVRCQHCGQRYSVREDLLGKQIKCKACGRPTALLAEPAAPNAASAKPASPPAAATSKRPATRSAAAPGPKQSSDARSPQPKQRAPAAAATGAVRAPAATQKPAAQKPAAPQPAAAANPLGPAAPAGDPLFGPQNNLLDLLDDASLPGGGAAPLGSGVVLKRNAAAVAEQPKTKKKKRKRSGEASLQAQALLRLMGGVLVILLGVGALGMALLIAVSEDDTGTKGFRAIRWTIFGFSIIGSGVKVIVG